MSRGRQNGFVLPLAAVGLALLALGLTMSLPADQQTARELRHARARLTLEQAAITAEARLTFLMLTEPVGLRGLEIGGGRLAADGSFQSGVPELERRELVFDGRPYRLDLAGRGSFLIRVQDEAGLVDIATQDWRLLENIAAVCTLSDSERSSLATYRRRPPATSQTGARSAGAEADEAWLRARIRPAAIAAISVTRGGQPPRLPTAPVSVLMAATGGNAELMRGLKSRQDGNNNTATMAVLYSQNDNKGILSSFSWGVMSNRVRIYVEPIQTSLNLRLPVYSYISRASVEESDPLHHFLARDSMINAGSRTQCYQSPGEAIVPLPYPGQPAT